MSCSTPPRFNPPRVHPSSAPDQRCLGRPARGPDALRLHRWGLPARAGGLLLCLVSLLLLRLVDPAQAQSQSGRWILPVWEDPTPAPPTVLTPLIPLDENPTALFDPFLADGFDYPIGDVNGRGSYRAPDGRRFSGWYIAASFAQSYDYGLHTGEDWNGRGGGDTDLGQPMFATAKGRVLFAQAAAAPFGNIVMIEHHYVENGSVKTVISQYDHLQSILVKEGQWVARRAKLGTIGKGARDFFPAHLHFELRRASLAGHRAEFWPSSEGWDEAMLREHYEVPSEFIDAHRQLVAPSSLPTLLVAIKHLNKLYFFKRGVHVSTFEIALSQEPTGQKEELDDNRMPEGAYQILKKALSPSKGDTWFPFFGPAWMKLSYPNAFDAQRGLLAGRITKKEYQAIVKATRLGQVPPQNTRLGGGIGIHGWIDSDWSNDGSRALTWGCISMHNLELQDLYGQVKIGTSVYIWP